jgi:hypothetical protein
MFIKTFENFNNPDIENDGFREINTGNSNTNLIEVYDDGVNFDQDLPLKDYDHVKTEKITQNFTELEKRKITRLLSGRYNINWQNRYIDNKPTDDITMAQMLEKNPPKDVYSKNSFIYNIFKCEDSWFYVMIYLNDRIKMQFYQCDQFYGLKNCITYINSVLDSFPKKYDKD